MSKFHYGGLPRLIKFEKIVNMPLPLVSKKVIRTLPYVALAVIFFALGAAGMYYYELHYAPQPEPKIVGILNAEEGKPASVDFKIFWETWAFLQEKYVGRKNLDFQEMIYGATKGLVNSLGDPYSTFFTPDEAKKFETSISGRFEGIGIEIGFRKAVLTVVAPLEGTPAKAAGLKAKDQILAIDGKSTAGMTLDEAVNLIRGPRGTKVTLTILRDAFEEPKEFTITREVINVPSVQWEATNEDIAHLKVFNFNQRSFWEFRQAVIEILNSGRKGIILDLRDNPGGFLDSAVDAAGWFLPKDSVVVKEDAGEGPYVCDACRANGNAALKDHKIVILVNSGTASAAEILAGALRDTLGIKLVGEKTFGKGSVQEVEELRGRASVKVTVAKWLTPSGVDITEKGLEPDIVVENPKGNEKDLQLEKAIEVVRQL